MSVHVSFAINQAKRYAEGVYGLGPFDPEVVREHAYECEYFHKDEDRVEFAAIVASTYRALMADPARPRASWRRHWRMMREFPEVLAKFDSPVAQAAARCYFSRNADTADEVA